MRTRQTVEIADDEDIWVPPFPSRSTLRAPRASRGAGRVDMVGPDRKVRGCHSHTEARVFTGVLARPDVYDLREQPPAITYIDERGRSRRHTFDATVTFHDGFRVAVLVKPEALAKRQRTDRLVAVIASQLSANVADGVLLMTEKDVGPDALHDAKLLNVARLHPCPAHDKALRAHLEQEIGDATIADLCCASALGGDGFRAVARLLADGTLVKLTPGRITPDTVVTRTTPLEKVS